MMSISRTDSVQPAPEGADAGRVPDGGADPTSVWDELTDVDRRAWMAVGGIAAVGALAGGALGIGVLESPLVPVVLLAAMAVAFVRAGWGWVAGPSRRARMRDSVLARVEEYGGGVYGTGAAITLLVLSASSFREEWAAASGTMAFLRGMTVEFWMGFSGESIRNAIQAGMWPLHWYANHGVWVAVAVGAAAWAGDAVADRLRRREAAAAGRDDGAQTSGASSPLRAGPGRGGA